MLKVNANEFEVFTDQDDVVLIYIIYSTRTRAAQCAVAAFSTINSTFPYAQTEPLLILRLQDLSFEVVHLDSHPSVMNLYLAASENLQISLNQKRKIELKEH